MHASSWKALPQGAVPNTLARALPSFPARVYEDGGGRQGDGYFGKRCTDASLMLPCVSSPHPQPLRRVTIPVSDQSLVNKVGGPLGAGALADLELPVENVLCQEQVLEAGAPSATSMLPRAEHLRAGKIIECGE